MAIEIVDFPIKDGDFPLLFVCSPEGIMTNLRELLQKIIISGGVSNITPFTGKNDVPGLIMFYLI